MKSNLIGAAAGAGAFFLLGKGMSKNIAMAEGVSMTKAGSIIMLAVVVLIGATVGFTAVNIVDEAKKA